MLESQGGFTFHPQHPTPNYGYMVGVGSSIIIENPDDVKLVLSGLWGKRKLPEGMFFGGWKHHGKIYLDIVKHFQNKQKAIRFGLDKKQIAIYELHSQSDIEL